MADILENRKINDIHVSRYIASWRNAGGRIPSLMFDAWLKHLGIKESDVRYINNFANIGKFELEKDADVFITDSLK